MLAHHGHRLAVMAPALRRGLRAAVLAVHRDEGVDERRRGEAAVKPPPEVVVHRHVQRAVEPADRFPRRASHERARLRDDVELRHERLAERPHEDRLAPARAIVDVPHAPVGHRRVEVRLERGGETREGAGQQPVVAVQPRHVRRLAARDALVDRGRLPRVAMAAPAREARLPFADHVERLVGRAGVAHEHLDRALLLEDRGERAIEVASLVERRDRHGDLRRRVHRLSPGVPRGNRGMRGRALRRAPRAGASRARAGGSRP